MADIGAISSVRSGGKVPHIVVRFSAKMFTDYRKVTFTRLFVTNIAKNKNVRLQPTAENPLPVEYLGIFTIAICSGMMYNVDTVAKSAIWW